LKDT